MSKMVDIHQEIYEYRPFDLLVEIENFLKGAVRGSLKIYYTVTAVNRYRPFSSFGENRSTILVPKQLNIAIDT